MGLFYNINVIHRHERIAGCGVGRDHRDPIADDVLRESQVPDAPVAARAAGAATAGDVERQARHDARRSARESFVRAPRGSTTRPFLRSFARHLGQISVFDFGQILSPSHATRSVQ
jgi:hypothetical protein